jgi:hypothetical protein
MNNVKYFRHLTRHLTSAISCIWSKSFITSLPARKDEVNKEIFTDEDKTKKKLKLR